MKKQFKLMALASATMLFAACSQENLLSPQEQLAQNPENNAIQFGTYLGKTGTTRAYSAGPIANETDATKGVTNLTEANFAVFSYFTGATDYVISPSTTSLAPNFMYNQQITWSTTNPTNAWTYSPAKYWPNGIDKDNASTPSNTATQGAEGKLSFFAYAPYIATPSEAYVAASDGNLPTAITSADKVKKNDKTNGISAMTTNDWTGNVWVKYLMPNANISQAVDLLWGTNGLTTYNETDAVDPTLASIGEGYNINLTKQKVTDRVKFLFKHALTKIGGNIEQTENLNEPATACNFEIKVDVDGNNGDNSAPTYFPTGFNKESTLVTVKEVKIMDGASAAEASLAATGTTSDLVKSGWFNIETGSWDASTVTTGARYSITANNTNTDDSDDTYTLNPKIKEGTVSNPAGTWTTANSGGAEGVEVTSKPLFAKETVPGLLLIPGGNQTIYISINYVVRTADTNLATGYTEVEQTITNKVSLTGLQPNKFYKIIMHLGLTSVKFEAKVADWATTDNGTYDGNGTYTPGTGSNPTEDNVWLPSNVVVTP